MYTLLSFAVCPIPFPFSFTCLYRIVFCFYTLTEASKITVQELKIYGGRQLLIAQPNTLNTPKLQFTIINNKQYTRSSEILLIYFIRMSCCKVGLCLCKRKRNKKYKFHNDVYRNTNIFCGEKKLNNSLKQHFCEKSLETT